ncbi:MAG: acyl carrier protein [Spirochaetes bacterium RBG_13_51_14]|nr:MAG: acyl carrier protein [Spirochaetes bacterium RBG_13_51_14]
MSAVFERVQKILMKQLNMDEDQVTGDALFVDDLGADSIDSVELMMAFEAEFKIDISENDAEGFHKVDDVIKYVESRIVNKK